ncbi:MAG: indole-3-glycerol phosphate synthase TrpC [Deltaproteobacteria bacterium]|nr:indole-3-glycerol phosphate synthase TrpC [Deltaproteobacteria bacterium]
MFLDKIVAEKREELKQRQETIPLPELRAAIMERPLPLNLAAALSGDSLRLIAEVKRASPSRGVLCPDLDPVKLAGTYAQCGAAAISVLTESRYFGGSREDLEAIKRALPDIPLLRKDFILKPYQIFESCAWGADAVLLIVAILDDFELGELLSLSHALGMQCLVEVHNQNELERALACGARIIGINNRDLDTMKVDINVTRQLRPPIPRGRVVVSESGIKGRDEVQKLKEWKVNAILVGEALVTADDVEAKIKELL